MDIRSKPDEDFGDPSGERWDSDGLGAARGMFVALLLCSPLLVTVAITALMIAHHLGWWK